MLAPECLLEIVQHRLHWRICLQCFRCSRNWSKAKAFLFNQCCPAKRHFCSTNVVQPKLSLPLNEVTWVHFLQFVSLQTRVFHGQCSSCVQSVQQDVLCIKLPYLLSLGVEVYCIYTYIYIYFLLYNNYDIYIYILSYIIYHISFIIYHLSYLI